MIGKIFPRAAIAAALVFLLAASATAAERGVMVREAVLYVAPDKTSAKLTNVQRGREVIILEASGDNWLHVMANVGREQDQTGWVQTKGVVRPSMPKADQIIFGEAVDSEMEASRAHGRRGAAEDAMRLYGWLAENMKQSPLAGEALYRAADIEWQLERDARWSRPSAKRGEEDWRADIPEDHMREVMKRYPKTKWADLAAFDLLDNQLCADWIVNTKCPEREATIYEKYVNEHPQSPKAPEALYEAAKREAALISMWNNEGQQDRIAQAKQRALALAGRITAQYSQATDWAARAETLLYYINQGIPTIGLSTE